MDFSNLLKTNSVKNNGKQPTHTRIGDKQFNIYGGSFAFDNEDPFYEGLYEHIFLDGKKEYLTEKQLENGTFVIDLDFRYSHDVETRQHTKQDIQDIVFLFNETLKKYVTFDNPFCCYVMEKPNVNRLADGSLTKDGIHLMYNFELNDTIKQAVRTDVIKEIPDVIDLPLINSWEDVIDEGVIKRACNWNIYGCSKPNNERYEVTDVFEFELDQNDGEFMSTKPEIDFDYNLFQELSVRTRKPVLQLNKEGEKIISKSAFHSISPTSITQNFELPESDLKLPELEFLLNVCIRENMCRTGDHDKWNTVAQILKNELKDDAIQYFVNWTNKFGSENKKSECINQITKFVKYTPLKEKNRLSYKTLHYYAKLYNPDAYLKRFAIKMDTDIDPDIQEVMATQTEYAFAKHFKNKFGNRFKCVSIKEKNVYHFTDNNLWDNEFEGCSKIREILSNDMLKLYKDLIKKFTDFKNKANLNSNTEEYALFNKKITVLGELCLKLQKTNDKNNITREILDKIEDINFNKDMNKEKYMLPVKGKKMLNMITLKLTDRTIKHKFNYECDAVFHLNMPEKEEADVKEYFMDLFCQKKKLVQTVLDILKSILTGVRTRYIYFFTGIGCNGKSLLFKLLTMVTGKAMDTIDRNVIIDQKNNSQITTQFEKLDKCRIGYVTELKDDMKLNEATIKQISGGDAIDLRGLFKTNVTIIPTCNLCVLTNEMPEIKIEKAIVDRLIRIPFNNVFQNDSTFEEKMISKKDFVFSYIMKYGVIRDKFELTEEMIKAKNETVEDNTKIDYLQKFIETYFEIVPFVKKEKKNRDTFRDAYNVFLKSHSQPMDKTADKKFTRDIKKYGLGIKEVGGKTFYTGIIEKVASEDEDE